MRRRSRLSRTGAPAILLAASLALAGIASVSASAAEGSSPNGPSRAEPVLADADADAEQTGGLEPTYQPRPPEPEPAYDSSYLFSLTRGVANSTLVPAAQGALFLFTIPLDLVLLPVTAIAGFF